MSSFSTLLGIALMVVSSFITALSFSGSNFSANMRTSAVDLQTPSTLSVQQIRIGQEDLKVPDVNGTASSPDVLVPATVNDAVPGSANKIRTFYLTVRNHALSARKIIVNENDIVRIKLNPSDQPYDLTLPDFGVTQTAPAGESRSIEFQAVSPGVHIFSCTGCRGDGALIVVPKT